MVSLIHTFTDMVAERQCDATMVVAQGSSEEEQVNVETATAARRRRSEEERWYGAGNSRAGSGGPVGVRQRVLVNGRWVTVAGGDIEYIKKLIVVIAQMERNTDLTVASDSLDVALKQEGRIRKVLDVCKAVEAAQNWVTEVESMDKQLFEACAREMEMMKGLLMELKDELILDWLNFVKGVVDSEDVPLNIAGETLRQNKILRVIKKKFVKKCLEMFAEFAEKNNDVKEFFEQLDKCVKFGSHEDSTVRAEIAELLRLNVPVDMPRQIPAVQVVQKTADVPQIQSMDRVDASVVQRQVLSVQTVQKTMQNSQAQFLDEVVGMPVVVQRKVPMVQKAQEIQERTVEQTIDGSVPQLKEEIIEVARQIPQEQVQSCKAEQIVDESVPRMVEETSEVVKHVPQERVHSNTIEVAKFDPEETGRVIQRIEQGRVRGRGGGDRKIYVKCRGEVRQVQEEELKKLMAEGSGEVYAVHGGRIVTLRAVEELKDGTMIQLVDRMPGGGKNKKKTTKKMVEEGEQSATDKSSKEADSVFEVLDRCFRKGVGGWSAEMTEAMLGMSDEKTEEMLKTMRSNFPEEVGNDPEMVIDGVRRFFRERRRRKRDQQQETRVQNADEGEDTNGPEEVKSGRGSAGCTRGGMRSAKRVKPAEKAKEHREAKTRRD